MKAIIGIGHAARLLGVTPRTVQKWFDKGLIDGFRLPESTDRRVYAKSLITFMEKNKMVIPAELLNLKGASNVTTSSENIDSVRSSDDVSGSPIGWTIVAIGRDGSILCQSPNGTRRRYQIECQLDGLGN